MLVLDWIYRKVKNEMRKKTKLTIHNLTEDFVKREDRYWSLADETGETKSELIYGHLKWTNKLKAELTNHFLIFG